MRQMSPVIHNTNRREKLILFLHYIIVINQYESKLTSSALHAILCVMILYCPQNVSSAEYVVSILTAYGGTPHPPLQHNTTLDVTIEQTANTSQSVQQCT